MHYQPAAEHPAVRWTSLLQNDGADGLAGRLPAPCPIPDDVAWTWTGSASWARRT
jgi:hypothetical protein